LRKSRILAAILAAAFILSTAAACGSTQNRPSAAPAQGAASSGSDYTLQPGPFPLVDNKTTLTMFKPQDIYSGSWNDLEMLKDLEEKTNVHIEATEAASDVFEEQFSLLQASGEYPDFFVSATWAGNEQRLGEDGVIIPIEDLIEQHAPSIKKMFEKYPNQKAAVTALNGHIYGAGQCVQTATMTPPMTYVNNEWLAASGKNMPDTVDEFIDLLVYFRDNKMPESESLEDQIPFLDFFDKKYFQIEYPLWSWFGEVPSHLNAYFNQHDGKVSYIPLSDGAKESVRLVKRLVDEKLTLDNIMTMSNDEATALVTSAKNVGISCKLPQSPNSQDFVTIMPTLKSDMDPVKRQMSGNNHSTGLFAITTACKDPALAIKWWDLFYREEADIVDGYCGLAGWIGRKGTDWDYSDDGNSYYTMFDQTIEDMNPWLYFIKFIGPGNQYGYIWMTKPSDSPYLGWVARQNAEFCYPFYDTSMNLPAGVRLLEEESKEAAAITADLEISVFEFRARYVMGQVNDGGWAQLESDCEAMGLSKVIDIYQTAYDRYLALQK